MGIGRPLSALQISKIYLVEEERAMFKKKALYLTTAVLLLAPIAAFGQVESPFKTGVREFSIAGSGASDESFDNTGFSTSFSLGQFFTDSLEGSIRQDFTYVDVSGEDDFSGSTRLGVDYHFGTGRLVPFVGGTFGFLYGDNVEDQFIAGPEGGLKFFLNSTTFAFAQLEYQILFDDDDDDGRFVYGIGLGMTF
jgi:hypothetical protein